jgi:N-acetylglutamate synthase-like GNAT family acetyltransferase
MIKFMIRFRKAQPVDSWAIRRLIYQVRINPLSLNWRRFLVAEDQTGCVIAAGQVKPHRDGTRELASIAVSPNHRHMGIASAMIRQLLAENELPLYLTCRASLETFYEKFGFRAISAAEMSPYFKFLYRISSLARKLLPKMEEMRVMVKTA